MAESAVKRVHLREKVLECPRDQVLMEEIKEGHATLDLCGQCGGQYFDAGEMFEAFGIKADPSYWDREETTGLVRDSELACPRCHAPMLAQDISYESEKVEIDRCRKCAGLWLDKGEAQQIVTIGEKMQPIIDAEVAKAKEELAKMETPNFSPTIISSFLALFKKKS